MQAKGQAKGSKENLTKEGAFVLSGLQNEFPHALCWGLPGVPWEPLGLSRGSLWALMGLFWTALDPPKH